MGTRVVTATVAAGVILAGVGWFRVRRLRRVRWIVAAVDAYAAFALIHASFNGIPLHAALAGHGFVQGFPRVLQGACIAGFGIIPIAWVFSMIRLGVRRLRRQTRVAAGLQAIAMTTCLALVAASLPQTADRGPGSPRPGTPASVAQTLETSFKALAAGERSTSRDRWDLDYVVARSGRDPRSLFAWVQKTTYWIPYRGVLRGPVGTLMDGQGNSLDRALLLATLLKKAGQTVRLARGRMTAEQADAILSSLDARRSVDFWTPAHLTTPPREDIRAIALRQAFEGAGMDGVGISSGAMAPLESSLDTRVREQAGRLLRAVRTGTGDDWNRRHDASIAAVRDHWWVQRRNGDSWIELDLLAGNAGSHLDVEDTTTIEPEQIPPEFWHQLVIRVVEEHSSARAKSEHRVLEYALRPADVIGRPIVLQFIPADWANGRYGVAPVSNVRSALLDQHEWIAGLAIGENTVASAVIEDATRSAAGGGDAGSVSSGRGGPLGGLAGAFEKSMAQTGADTPSLTAVWIEYEIRSPDEAARTIRRSVLDLLGPSSGPARDAAAPALRLDETARLTRSLAMTTRTEILPMVGQLSEDFVAHLAGGSLLAAAGVLHDIGAGRTPPRGAIERLGLAGARPPLTDLLVLALTRFNGGRSGDVFVDRVNILTRHASLVAAADGVALRRAFDIVANDVGVGLATRDGFAARLDQGVRDTNAEALLVKGGAAGSAAEAFAASSDWTVLRRGERVPDLARRLRGAEKDLSDGFVLVTPPEALRSHGEVFSGWWRIHPETGATLGVGANGWGQAAEYGRQMNLAFAFSRGFVFEYALCQSFPLAMNSIKIINEEVFGGWNPSWTAPASKSRDPLEVADENMNMCIVQAIVAGFAATLPLILMTWRVSEPARGMQMVKRVIATEEELEAAGAGRPCLGLLQQPWSDRVFAFFLPSLAAASFQGCGGGGKGPRDTLPDTTKYGPNRTIVEEPDPQTLKRAGMSRVPTKEEVDEALAIARRLQQEMHPYVQEYVQYMGQPVGRDPLVERALRERAESFFKDVFSPAVSRYKLMDWFYKYYNGL